MGKYILNMGSEEGLVNLIEKAIFGIREFAFLNIV